MFLLMFVVNHAYLIWSCLIWALFSLISLLAVFSVMTICFPFFLKIYPGVYKEGTKQ